MSKNSISGRKMPSALSNLLKAKQGAFGKLDGSEAQEVLPSVKLRLYPEALDWFFFYTKNVPKGHFRQTDEPSLSKLCFAQVVFERMNAEVMALDGFMEEEEGKQSKPNPLITLWRQMAETVSSMTTQLGLGTRDRLVNGWQFKRDGETVLLDAVSEEMKAEMEKEAEKEKIKNKFFTGQFPRVQ